MKIGTESTDCCTEASSVMLEGGGGRREGRDGLFSATACGESRKADKSGMTSKRRLLFDIYAFSASMSQKEKWQPPN